MRAKVAKKTEKEQNSKYVNWEKADQHMTDETVTDSLRDRYMPYAMSVIVSRALPSIDGFKPSQRKILYEMYTMGLLKGQRTKSANIVGATMHLNPHGDASIYDAMVRMGRGCETLLVPYVDSKGNFGKAYSRDMAAAASRYTEAKLEPICEYLFNDIAKNTVDMVPNYDSTTTEPSLLPASFPTILANNVLGIAVGMACNICSFNLAELCQTTIEMLNAKPADADKLDLTQWMPAPDFVGGGQIILNRSDIKQVYETGRGSIRVRGRYQYQKAENVIEVTQIPPTTTVEAIIERVIELSKNGKIKEINDIRDETDLDGLKITIDLKRGADPEKLMARLFKLTPLEDTFSCNFNILIDGKPQVLGVRAILKEWIRFRTDCVRRRTQYDLENNLHKLHLLEGLQKILLDIDKAVKIIRETKLDADVVPNLMKGFDIDEEQANYVADIKLRNINREYILKRTADIKDLNALVKKLDGIIKSDSKIRKVIADELAEVIKVYGRPRKSELVTEVLTAGKDDAQDENTPDDYPVTVFFSKEGYFKKVTPLSLRMSAGAEQKLKDGDEIAQSIETGNAADLVFFTNQFNAYKSHVYDFNDTKISVMGSYMPSELGMADGESILAMACTKDYSGWLVLFFENGKAVRVPLAQYQTKQNRKKLINAYCDKFPVVGMFVCTDESTAFTVSVTGRKPFTVNLKDIVEKVTKTSYGSQFVTLKGKKRVVSVRIDHEEAVEQLSIDEGGSSVASAE